MNRGHNFESHKDEALLDNAAFLETECGMHIDAVCARLGVKKDTLEQMRRRRKEKDDAA